MVQVQCPSTQCCRRVWVPKIVKQEQSCTRYVSEVKHTQCPYTVCRQVPCQSVQKVPYTTCTYTQQTCTSTSPTRPAPTRMKSARRRSLHGAAHGSTTPSRSKFLTELHVAQGSLPEDSALRHLPLGDRDLHEERSLHGLQLHAGDLHEEGPLHDLPPGLRDALQDLQPLRSAASAVHGDPLRSSHRVPSGSLWTGVPGRSACPGSWLLEDVNCSTPRAQRDNQPGHSLSVTSGTTKTASPLGFFCACQGPNLTDNLQSTPATARVIRELPAARGRLTEGRLTGDATMLLCFEDVRRYSPAGRVRLPGRRREVRGGRSVAGRNAEERTQPSRPAITATRGSFIASWPSIRRMIQNSSAAISSGVQTLKRFGRGRGRRVSRGHHRGPREKLAPAEGGRPQPLKRHALRLPRCG